MFPLKNMLGLCYTLNSLHDTILSPPCTVRCTGVIESLVFFCVFSIYIYATGGIPFVYVPLAECMYFVFSGMQVENCCSRLESFSLCLGNVFSALNNSFVVDSEQALCASFCCTLCADMAMRDWGQGKEKPVTTCGEHINPDRKSSLGASLSPLATFWRRRRCPKDSCFKSG